MPVYTKSYIGAEGSNQISDPTLAFARILDLARDGTDYTQVTTPAAGAAEFSFDVNTGLILFHVENPFNAPGQKVEVIYSGGSPAPPPDEPPVTCDPVASATATAVGMTIQVVMPVAGNYLVDIIAAAGTCGDTPVDSGVIMGGTTYTSIGLADGSYKACVKVDCGGGLLSTPVASNTATITTPPENFNARKVMPEPSKKIISITGFSYVIRTGSLPLVAGNSQITGRHEGFTAAIAVTVSVTKKQQVVVAIYKNAVLFQFLVGYRTTDGNVTLTFNVLTALSTDDVAIQMDYT